MDPKEKSRTSRVMQQKRPDGKGKKRRRQITESNIPRDKIPGPERYKKTITRKVPVLGGLVGRNAEAETAEDAGSGWEILLVSRISKELISLTAEGIDEGVNWALKQIGESPYVDGIDRCYVFLFSDDRMIMESTHEWCARGVLPNILAMEGGVSISEFPWLMDKMREPGTRSIYVPFVSKLPPAAEAERRIFESQDVQTLLVVPMICRDNIFGFASFESVRSVKSWREEDRALIKTVVDIFMSCFKRIGYENQLRRDKEFLTNIIESLGHPFYVVDADDCAIVLANSTSGFRLSAGCENSAADCISSEHMDVIREVKRTGKPVLKEHHCEERGRIRIHHIRGAPLFDTLGKITHTIVYYLDVTEEKLREIKSMESQKMSAVGKLAGGIANSFNNMLAGIGMNAEMLRRGIDEGHPGNDYLKNIEESVSKGGRIVRQLLDFASPIRYEARINDINTLIRRSSRIFELGHEDILIRKNLDNEVWGVDVDGSQMEQVLFSLYMNASGSMPNGGDLTLQTKNVVLADKLDHLKPGRYVVVTVADSGFGMDDEMLKGIFDPFYRTGESDCIIRMGLASALRIVKSHGGHITAENAEEMGSRFKVYLPAIKSRGFYETTPSVNEPK